MRFALLVGCLSLCACAAVVTMRLRSSLSRKLSTTLKELRKENSTRTASNLSSQPRAQQSENARLARLHRAMTIRSSNEKPAATVGTAGRHHVGELR